MKSATIFILLITTIAWIFYFYVKYSDNFKDGHKNV